MENQSVTEEVPTENAIDRARIEAAAHWLFENTETCTARLFPTLKERFGLRNIDAIEAAKIAGGLRRGGSL